MFKGLIIGSYACNYAFCIGSDVLYMFTVLFIFFRYVTSIFRIPLILAA